jgi:hypothetical protein
VSRTSQASRAEVELRSARRAGRREGGVGREVPCAFHDGRGGVVVAKP